MNRPLQPSPELHGDPPAAAAPGGVPDQNELARIAVERTRMPMVVTDARAADQPIVLANRAFLELTGYSGEEVIGRNCRFLQGEGTSAAAVDEIRAAIKAERELEIELLNYRKDGSAFWNQLGLSPVHDDDGKLLYYFGSQIDVTELRKVQVLEESEHRLLLEVDHRARNALAVVNGIVRLSRSDDSARYAAAIQQRVHALAEAHTLLAERGWNQAPLDGIVRRQTRSWGEDRISLDGPELLVSAFVVQPLAMVIHELADNAARHGALSRPSGAVQVSWRPQDRGFNLVWEETGGPPRPVNPRPGFGDAMLTGLVEHQLRGQVERDWSDQGLKVTLKVPDAVQNDAGAA